MRNPFSSGKASSGTEGCWQAEAKDYEEHPEEADTAPCCPGNMMLSCMHHSCAFQRWNEGWALSTLSLHKNLEKTQRLVQTKTWALAIRFLFLALPCCCRYWNLNAALGSQEPGSHRNGDLWAATPAVPPVALHKQLVVHPQSPGDRDCAQLGY